MSKYNFDTNVTEFDPDADLTALRGLYESLGLSVQSCHDQIKSHSLILTQLKANLEVCGKEMVLVGETIKLLESRRSIASSAADEGIGGFDS